jgi:hypothetical protein
MHSSLAINLTKLNFRGFLHVLKDTTEVALKQRSDYGLLVLQHRWNLPVDEDNCSNPRKFPSVITDVTSDSNFRFGSHKLLNSEIFLRATPSMMLLDWFVRSSSHWRPFPSHLTPGTSVSKPPCWCLPKPTVFEDRTLGLFALPSTFNLNRAFSGRFEKDNGKREATRLSLFPFPSRLLHTHNGFQPDIPPSRACTFPVVVGYL